MSPRTLVNVKLALPCVGLVASAMALLGGGLARADLVIVPTFDSSITSDPNAAAIEGAINAAIAVYQAKFTDPINVPIYFQEMSSGLGQSDTSSYNIPYTAYLAALTADATTANDAIALSHFPGGPNNPVTGNPGINVKSANLRAVGLPGAPAVTVGANKYDGQIGLNTHLTNPGSVGSSAQFLLQVAAEHQIDEVLGLGSSLPSDPFNDPSPEDLFRYDSGGHRSHSTISSAQSFFSIDTTTLLAQFDNQNDGGDWGDWQSNPLLPGVQPKVQDAFTTPGANPALSVEITALDVIGYDPTGESVIPEPAGLTAFGVWALILTGYRRRCRPRA